LYNRDDEFSDVIAGQIKNQVVEFDLLVKILDTSNEKEVKGIVLEILENNYPFEYARYKARRQCLDY
jgi:predicted CopG family antitoxin